MNRLFLTIFASLTASVAFGQSKPSDHPHALNAEPATATSVRPQNVAPPSKNERIVLIGNGLAERDVYYSAIETELHLRYPEEQLFLRNMGRPGDYPWLPSASSPQFPMGFPRG